MDVDMETEVALALVQQAGQHQQVGKRSGEDAADAAGGGYKRIRLAPVNDEAGLQLIVPNIQAEGARVALGAAERASAGDRVMDVEDSILGDASQLARPELRPYPYFYYRDYSKDVDPDPLAPLTPPGRVPNFPAKMHAILSRGELSEIVSWMPHGRAWRVLKPREFEVKVVPLFFEHAKFSSFIRQANGWGFRRITQGRDRNCYYHELFLRGLPFLCKNMKRPAVAEKQAANPDQEPDFYKISEEHPLPEKAEDETILLHCTIQGGPKARMPIYTGSLMPAVSIALPESKPPALSSTSSPQLPPRDHSALTGFQAALGASELQLKALSFSNAPAGPPLPSSGISAPTQKPHPPIAPLASPPKPLSVATTASLSPSVAQAQPPFAPSINPVALLPPSTFLPNNMPLPFHIHNCGGADASRLSPLASASRLAFNAVSPAPPTPAASSAPPLAASDASGQVLPDLASAAQFAAGFAAATALSQQQLRSVLSSFTFIPKLPAVHAHMSQAPPAQAPPASSSQVPSLP